MIRLYILLFISLSLLPVSTLAQEPGDLSDHPEKIEAYFGLMNKQSTDESATILFQEQKMEISDASTSMSRYYRLAFSEEKLMQVNDVSDLDKITAISLPFNADVRVKNVTAITYNMENGRLVSQRIERSDMIKEKIEKNFKILKFNFPAVKKGSMIYYTFSYRMDIKPHLPFKVLPISFQEDVPVIDAYFDLTIPANNAFTQKCCNVTLRSCNSFDELNRDSSGLLMIKHKEEKRYIWHRHDVPAFKKESLVSDDDAHKERIILYANLATAPSLHDSMLLVPQTWAKVDNILYMEYNSTNTRIIKDSLQTAIRDILKHPSDQADSAKQLYAYVRDSIKSIASYSRFSERSPLTVLKDKKGTYTDKNILLCALLRQSGFLCYPVVLSTIDNGRLDPAYFNQPEPDYLIAAVTINHKACLLDASFPMLSFGMLNPECYNGFSWMLAGQGAGIDISPDLMPNKYLCSATLEPQDSAYHFRLTMMERAEGLSAYEWRKKLRKDSTSYEEEIRTRMSNWAFQSKLAGITIDNKNNPDTSLYCTSRFDIILNKFSDLGYFNPMLKKFFTKNPLINRETSRKYDIELGTPYDFTYLLRMKLPKDMRIADFTPSTRINYPDNSMKYEANVANEEQQNTFSFSVRFRATKTVYPAQQYSDIFNFFEKVVEEQNKKIVLKKTPQ